MKNRRKIVHHYNLAPTWPRKSDLHTHATKVRKSWHTSSRQGQKQGQRQRKRQRQRHTCKWSQKILFADVPEITIIIWQYQLHLGNPAHLIITLAFADILVGAVLLPKMSKIVRVNSWWSRPTSALQCNLYDDSKRKITSCTKVARAASLTLNSSSFFRFSMSLSKKA